MPMAVLQGKTAPTGPGGAVPPGRGSNSGDVQERLAVGRRVGARPAVEGVRPRAAVVISIPQKLLHYDVLERLGEGARSTVYAVSDPVTGQVYALKHVVRSDTKDIRFVEQMEAEFDISRQFTHKNLRRTYDLKINKTLLLKVTEAYLIMELVDGKPLDVQPPLNLLEGVDTFIQSAHGLQAMHGQRLTLPRRAADAPSRDLLAWRWERFARS